ncbi:MAG: carboxypeptidase M32 [Thermoflexales bacterium]|nr:carboxypeptidase M32 [Thermoflexales bacterium]
MREQLDTLRTRLAEVTDLYSTLSLLLWDQEIYMPPQGILARAEQISTLRGLAHQKFIADEIGLLLQDLNGQLAALDPESNDACLLRVTAREYAKARRVPAELEAALGRAVAIAYDAWVKARAASDFALLAPHLQQVLDLTLQKAEALGYDECVYDALLDTYEPGMKTSQVAAVFAVFKPEIVALLQAISQHLDAVDDACLYGEFDEGQQWALTLKTLGWMGFDFQRGRQDRSAHPFTTSMSPRDVRVTTRIYRAHVGSALFSSLHEGGHALYDQGIPIELDRTPLGTGASLGVHESQARMWENMVGRSRGFWRFFFPHLKHSFPAHFDSLDAERLYRAVNKAQPSLIRVEADEVTYNLHILLRFDLENDLLEGRLKVVDLPAAWNAKMEEYLGLTPPDDAQGVLQDVHWASGLIGYFPTYALGNLLAAQLFERIRLDLPGLDAHVEAGQFAPLLDWLRQHVYCHGAKFTPADLIQRVTGQPLQAGPFVRYLKAKYGELYGLA